MRAKQKKIRVFDIFVENENSFFEYMKKNQILLKDYLLVVDGEVSEKIIDFLDSNGFCYILQAKCHIKMIDSPATTLNQSSNKNEQEQKDDKKIQIIKEVIVKKDASNTKVIKKPIRSGEVVESDSDIVIFSRVNSGAKVICEANASIFGEIDGVVEVNGEFLILKSINKGYVIFNGDILEKDDFDGRYKKVIKYEDGYKIEDL